MVADFSVVRAKDMQVGMIVVPYVGNYFRIPDSELYWEPVLRRDSWQHIVAGVSDTHVHLARPYVMAQQHAMSPLIGCEQYTIPITSEHPYLLLAQNKIR